MLIKAVQKWIFSFAELNWFNWVPNTAVTTIDQRLKKTKWEKHNPAQIKLNYDFGLFVMSATFPPLNGPVFQLWGVCQWSEYLVIWCDLLLEVIY